MPVKAQDVDYFINKVIRESLSGVTTEHSFRGFFKPLFESVDNIEAINEPTRSEHGAPDYVFLNKNNYEIIRGYAEMKDLNKNLDEIEKTDQIDRYKGYENIILTNNLDWRFFRNGEKYFEIKIGEYNAKEKKITGIYKVNYERLADEINAFFELTPERIRSGARLAEIMGGKARRIRDQVDAIINSNVDSKIVKRDEDIEAIYQMMKELLVSDLKRDAFADMYAQTLVYGLFVARYNDDTPKDFSRIEARELVPATNPFLREFFNHIAGPNFNKGLSYIVDELCDIFAVSDIKDIVHKHLHITEDGENEAKDPIIHFYEDFLAAYDLELRKKMGAYYTPIPVVRYIISMVDKVLKEDFGIPDGISSNEKIKYTHRVDQYFSSAQGKAKHERTDEIPKVQILDPAVGTATFLNEIVKYIYVNKFRNNAGAWPSYVNENILPRLNGFELMMTPYTIAHLKLGMTLSELGAKNLNDRLRIFLTNTLTEGEEKELPLFAFGLQKVVTEESNYASEVKNDLPVMVVIGNPPYSGVSSNETKYANSLIEKYKVEPGGEQKLQERKHWLNDDYVKFIAFAEDMVTKNGKGVVAMITNNGYIDNPTFRGMRWKLASSFDKIYILNLHGNAKKREMAPDGTKDENVFDIMQGVSIMIAVKTSTSQKIANVYYSELYGLRKNKFKALNGGNITYKKINMLDSKMMYFVPKSNDGREEYERGIPLNELMPINTTGIVTMGDNFIVTEKPEIIADRVKKLVDGYYDEEKLDSFGLGKNYAKYVLGNRPTLKYDGAKIVELAYRPFDKRFTYYDNKVIWRWREKVMRNFLGERSEPHTHTHTPRRLAMIFNKPAQGGPEIFTDIFVTEFITDQSIFSAMKRSPYVAPLQINRDINQVGVVFERSVTDEVFAVDSMPEHAFLGTAGFAGQSAPLYALGNNQYSDNYYANFDRALVEKLFSEVEQPDEKSKKVNEYDLFDYIYGSLHSPSYREKYKEFLKTDFPRIPRPKNWKEFWRLVKLGRELRELHLMHGNIEPTATYPEFGSNKIEKISYSDNKVWINETQYFDNVSELAWNFYIGGYQPAQKWLKDRKRRELSFEDIEHYGKIITVLNETDRIMKEIG